MRGKAASGGDREPGAGITPAYAGKSDPEKQPGAARWDHPRVCGEKLKDGRNVRRILGSPPRMRGKGDFVHQRSSLDGITPAYAGKSFPPLLAPSWTRDHPRVCGEKARCSVTGSKFWGSPPRVRGKGPVRRRDGAGMGITPAYAGKRLKSRETVMPSWDHPRVCGEKNGICRAKVPHLGSPPRMRGKALCGLDVHIHAGITPAYAGKRYKVLPDTCGTGDYPRVCGEKYDAPP